MFAKSFDAKERAKEILQVFHDLREGVTRTRSGATTAGQPPSNTDLLALAFKLVQISHVEPS